MIFSCVMLAAGRSTRMGGANKLVLPVGGTSLVKRTLEQVLAVPLRQVIVVTGHQHEIIEQELKALGGQRVHNPRFTEGMHTSLRAGIEQLKSCDYFFVCLSDQPKFSALAMQTLMGAAETDSQHQIFTLNHDGQQGHPVLFSSKLIPEILREQDGDFGLNYLLKRYPELVRAIPVNDEGILLDMDTPEEYARLEQAPLPQTLWHQEVARLHQAGQSFAVATVIEVLGSASAKTGSKAIFVEGRNILGYVGGGCAERFVAEECLAALEEKATRIVLADLDDEIFGLGIACGGKMRVFIEPVLPAEQVVLPPTNYESIERALAHFYGWTVKTDPKLPAMESVDQLMLKMAQTIAKQRGLEARSLRLVKEVPAQFVPTRPTGERVTVLGRTRITEALARHFTMLGYRVRVVGPDLKTQDYPESVQCDCLLDSYDDVSFTPGEIVVVAGHTAQDPHLVRAALDGKASHVAMVGSYKRSLEVLHHLDLLNEKIEAPLYIPAGLDIGARNPDEIALSIVAEILQTKEAR